MPQENHFLATLEPGDLALVRPGLERVTLRRNAPIAEIDRPVSYALLPVSSIISVITVMRDGRMAESRTIGSEGGFGLLHSLGSRTSFERVVVQVGGEAWRIALSDLQQAAGRSPSLVRAIVRHAQATLVQAAQFMACNTLHTTPPRLCKWLLMTQDRLGGDELPLTQEHMAIMLGVQRTTVTTLASALQDQGLIAYSRGQVRVLNREGLKRGACECYGALTKAVDRILREPA
jgi:CRP-like cAMP-binding protein